MKSKAHSKKCVELGIVPVPTSADDPQADESSKVCLIFYLCSSIYASRGIYTTHKEVILSSTCIFKSEAFLLLGSVRTSETDSFFR